MGRNYQLFRIERVGSPAGIPIYAVASFDEIGALTDNVVLPAGLSELVDELLSSPVFTWWQILARWKETRPSLMVEMVRRFGLSRVLMAIAAVRGEMYLLWKRREDADPEEAA